MGMTKQQSLGHQQKSANSVSTGIGSSGGGTNNGSSTVTLRQHQQQQQQRQNQHQQKHTIHWFRKGLRLHDNPALREGLKDAASFRCVFVIDPWFAGSSNVGINKWRSMYDLRC